MAGPEEEKEEVKDPVVGTEDYQLLGVGGSGGSSIPHLQLNKILVISQM